MASGEGKAKAKSEQRTANIQAQRTGSSGASTLLALGHESSRYNCVACARRPSVRRAAGGSVDYARPVLQRLVHEREAHGRLAAALVRGDSGDERAGVGGWEGVALVRAD